MPILKRIWGESKAQAIASQSFTPMDHEMVRSVFGGGGSYAGKAVSEQSALSVAAHWSCVRLLSESIGMMPWSLYRKDASGNSERADDHPLQEILVRQPNRDETPVEFRETIGMNLAGNGNFYALIGSLGRRVISLTPLISKDVRPIRKLGSNTNLRIPDGEKFFRVNDRGRQEDMPREKIWHVRLFGNDRLIGLSPIAAAREALGGALAQDEFANRFFGQGGVPAGTVSYPGWLTEQQRTEARRHLQELVGGLGKAHQFAMFEGGVKPEPWNAMSLEDMQFIFSRRFSVVEICRFHRVPPHLVYELEKASFASIEAQHLEFLTFSLQPYFARIEAAVLRWLLPLEDQSRYSLKFNAGALLRTTTKERYEAHASALQNGWKNRNEVRGLEDMNLVSGLDEYTAQVNMMPVQDLGKKPEPAPPPATDEAEDGMKSRPVTNVNVAIPGDAEREGKILATLDSCLEGQGQLVKAVCDLGARLVSIIKHERDESAALVAEAMEGVSKQVAASNRALDDSTGAARAVAAEIKKAVSQRRKVVVDGEEFISEPVEERAPPAKIQ